MNFHPPFSELPSFFFFLYLISLISLIEVEKIHPPFQNPGSVPDPINRISKAGAAIVNTISSFTPLYAYSTWLWSELIFALLILHVLIEDSFLITSHSGCILRAVASKCSCDMNPVKTALYLDNQIFMARR